MMNRLVSAAALVHLAAGPAAASPISYAFTGTLDTPLNGSREFSGTITLASAPTWISFGWPNTVVPADITLNAGGHTFEFSGRNPRTGMHELQGGLSPSWNWLSGQPRQDEVAFLGSAALDSPGSGHMQFGITSYAPSPKDPSEPHTINFVTGTSSIYMLYDDNARGEHHVGGGVITSFTPIATPEPATWLVALIVGGAAALRLRRPA